MPVIRSPTSVNYKTIPGNEQSLLTPARRAALDALEREFQELLQLAAR